MHIALFSLGNLGTAIARQLAVNGHTVSAYEHDPAVVEEVNRHHRNSRYLPGIVLPPEVLAVDQPLRALHADTRLLFTCLPSRHVRRVFDEVAPHLASNLPVANFAKGIETSRGLTVMQVLGEILHHNPVAMVSGPSLANEFSRGIPTSVVAASTSASLPGLVRQVLSSPLFSVLESRDVLGVELGGIFKNAYALGLGFASADGEPGRNFTGAYLAMALEEMQALGVAMGADPATFTGMAGLGDLVATALSEHSHNAHLGHLLGQGLTLAQAEKELGMLPEGWNTLQQILSMAELHHVSAPLAALIGQTLTTTLSRQDFFLSFQKLVR